MPRTPTAALAGPLTGRRVPGPRVRLQRFAGGRRTRRGASRALMKVGPGRAVHAHGAEFGAIRADRETFTWLRSVAPGRPG